MPPSHLPSGSFSPGDSEVQGPPGALSSWHHRGDHRPGWSLERPKSHSAMLCTTNAVIFQPQTQPLAVTMASFLIHLPCQLQQVTKSFASFSCHTLVLSSPPASPAILIWNLWSLFLPNFPLLLSCPGLSACPLHAGTSQAPWPPPPNAHSILSPLMSPHLCTNLPPQWRHTGLLFRGFRALIPACRLFVMLFLSPEMPSPLT